MKRLAPIMSVVLALHAGCSNQNKKADPPVDHKDAPRVEPADAPPARPPITDEQVERALAVMADPASKTDQGEGQAAMLLVEAWLKRGPDGAARQRASNGLEKVVAEGSTFMRTRAYELLAEFSLPGASRILIAEIENPARDVRERDLAARSLGLVLEDFELLRGWMKDDQPLHWEAALAAMKTFQAFDADAQAARWDERRLLLIGLARRPTLPAQVVYDLAFWFEIYLDEKPDDAELRALVTHWSNHPDDMAAGQMKKLMARF